MKKIMLLSLFFFAGVMSTFSETAKLDDLFEGRWFSFGSYLNDPNSDVDFFMFDFHQNKKQVLIRHNNKQCITYNFSIQEEEKQINIYLDDPDLTIFIVYLKIIVFV